MLALSGEEAGQMNGHSGIRRLQPLRYRAQAYRLDFAVNAPRTACFDLLRLMPDHTFSDRQTGRGETLRFALDQYPGELDAIQ